MIRDRIKELALSIPGLELKEQPDGTRDLRPYLYELVEKAVEEDRESPFKPLEWTVFGEAYGPTHYYEIRSSRASDKITVLYQRCGHKAKLATGHASVADAKQWAQDHLERKLSRWVKYINRAEGDRHDS